jgi:uncharacterized membrane protein
LFCAEAALIRYINPNYHVILIHYPLALLGVGLLIELLATRWPASSLRAAGCWMLLLGAFACGPAAASGIFAKYDVMQQLAGDDASTWQEVRSGAGLTHYQWHLLNRHVLYSSIGSVMAILAAVVWLASSPRWPRPAGPALWTIFAVAMGLMVVGARGAGELVYTTQFATRSQAHVIGAGILAALLAAALGASLQKSAQLRRHPPAKIDEADGPSATEFAAAPTAALGFLAALAAAATLLVGWYVFSSDAPSPWDVTAVFRYAIWQPFHKDPAGAGRVLVHLLLGGGIVVLAVFLVFAARWGARSRLLIGFLGLLVIAALAAQIGIGILMLYDTDSGPLTHFNAAVPASPQGPTVAGG